VRIRRLLGAALAMPVLLGGLVLVTAGSAAACSCAITRSEADRVARADAVFVGTLVSQVDRIDQRARELMRSSDPAVVAQGLQSDSSRTVWTFEVSRVYKGAVGKRQEIVAPPGGSGGANCSGLGLRSPGPGPFLVFAYSSAGDLYRLEAGQYASNMCSGSRSLTDGEPALGGLPAHEPSGRDSSPPSTRGGLSAGGSGGPDSSPSPAEASPNRPPATSGGLVATGTGSSDAHSTATVSLVGVGVLAAGVVAGLGLATLRARRRASAD
jgi:hypothetical protein